MSTSSLEGIHLHTGLLLVLLTVKPRAPSQMFGMLAEGERFIKVRTENVA